MGFFTKKNNKNKIDVPKETQLEETQIEGTQSSVSPHTKTENKKNNKKSELAQSSKNPLGGIAWYEKNYYMAMKLAVFLAFSLIASIGFSVFLYMTRPTPIYYAVTPDLRVAKLVPLTQPVMTEQGLLNWTSQIVTSSISLDFVDWREKLQSIRPNFASDAFSSFTKSMKDAGILDLIQSKRLNLSSVVQQAPVITNSGIINGSMSWKIEFPVLLSYESSQGVELTQELLAEVLVSRASTVTTPQGVVIKQMILKRN